MYLTEQQKEHLDKRIDNIIDNISKYCQMPTEKRGIKSDLYFGISHILDDLAPDIARLPLQEQLSKEIPEPASPLSRDTQQRPQNNKMLDIVIEQLKDRLTQQPDFLETALSDQPLLWDRVRTICKEDMNTLDETVNMIGKKYGEHKIENNKFDQLMKLLEGMTYDSAKGLLTLALDQIGFASTVQKYY